MFFFKHSQKISTKKNKYKNFDEIEQSNYGNKNIQ